jgi:hypothetical protein
VERFHRNQKGWLITFYVGVIILVIFVVFVTYFPFDLEKYENFEFLKYLIPAVFCFYTALVSIIWGVYIRLMRFNEEIGTKYSDLNQCIDSNYHVTTSSYDFANEKKDYDLKFLAGLNFGAYLYLILSVSVFYIY